MDSLFIPWLDRKVSVYEGVVSRSCSEVSLREFLFSYPLMCLERILRVRSLPEGDERTFLKRSLPMCTVSALFSGPRSLDSLVSRTGLLCLDIDAKDNPGVGFQDVVRILSPLPYILYIGLSVRGEGAFAIVPVSSPCDLRGHFLSLERAFRNKGLVVDPSCKDLTRLRCVSYSPDAYVNEDAVPYRYLLKPKRTRAVRPFSQAGFSSPSYSRVSRLCDEIVRRGADITEPYDSWFRIGCALHSELGEGGRRFFHAVSSVSPKYDPASCDLQFDRCSRIGGISIATFFRLCADAGFDINPGGRCDG